MHLATPALAAEHIRERVPCRGCIVRGDIYNICSGVWINRDGADLCCFGHTSQGKGVLSHVYRVIGMEGVGKGNCGICESSGGVNIAIVVRTYSAYGTALYIVGKATASQVAP